MPTPADPLRVAVWSGPRTLSTAFLRAWGQRPDTAATDEPLYAHYLATTGLEHPGRAEVLASQPHDWRAVSATLTGVCRALCPDDPARYDYALFGLGAYGGAPLPDAA